MMRRWLLGGGMAAATLTLVATMFAGAQAADALRLATVDIQKILVESKAGKQAQAKVQAERDLRQKELTSREEEIAKLQKDFEKQASILSEPARKEKQEAIERKVRDLRRIYDDFNRELQKKESELIRDLLKVLTVLIQDYGKQKGYTLILERGQSSIVYAADQIDLTKEILTLFDTKTK